MLKLRSFMSILAVLAVAGLPLPAGAAGSTGGLERAEVLTVPGKALTSFDIGFVNEAGIYALSDRSNGGLDLFNAQTGRFLGRAAGFAGFNEAVGSKGAGPNGVVAVGNGQFWAGDGDSSVKVVDVRSRKVIASISTHGRHRTDEIAYDPHDHLVIAVNNADSPPFVSFISTVTRKVVGRLELPQATDGAEQPLYDPVTRLIYLSIPVVGRVKADGAVAVISPRTHRLIRMLPVSRCMPAGLALGPLDRLLLGCSDDGVDAGFPAHSIVMQARTGKVVADVPVGGSDEVWSSLSLHRYYTASAANKGGPALGVIDSLDDRLLAVIPTGPHAHSVAADDRGRVFVPISAHPSADCVRGCIVVFAPRHR